jgi:DNA transformation protein
MDAKRLSDLRNLGPKSEQMLKAAGIDTPQALLACGAVDAFIAIKHTGQPASLNLLWALQGALSDRDWREVARDDKLHFLSELEARGIRI